MPAREAHDRIHTIAPVWVHCRLPDRQEHLLLKRIYRNEHFGNKGLKLKHDSHNRLVRCLPSLPASVRAWPDRIARSDSRGTQEESAAEELSAIS